MTQEDFVNAKETFVALLKSTERSNIDGLIRFLEKNDFFDAPSSCKYHSAFKHGLLFHSINVYNNLFKLAEVYDPEHTIKSESLIVTGLLHDVCKTSFYAVEKRNKKIDGVWHEVDTYVVNDHFPAGHGEKSVIMLQQFIKLTMEEILAIDWHMGGYDIRCYDYQGKSAISTAMEKYKLVVLLQMADVAATYLEETRE